MLVPRHYLGQD